MDSAVTCVHRTKMKSRDRSSQKSSDLEEGISDLIATGANAERFSSDRITRLFARGARITGRDNPCIYVVPGVLAEDDGILKMSNQEFPDVVDKEVRKSAAARGLLSEELAMVIPTPIVAGRFMERSYAIWPRYRPISSHRLRRAVQKRSLNGNLFAWLRGVAEVSINRNLISANARCRMALEHVRENHKQSERIRSKAERALRRYETGDWRPVSVLQHGDFWLGNVLLPRSPRGSLGNRFGFFAIDWGGSLVDGAPGFDLLRLCLSAGIPLRRGRKEFLKYMQSIQLDAEAMIFEVLVALGFIGTHLDQFPEENYLAMCNSCIDYLGAIGF